MTDIYTFQIETMTENQRWICHCWLAFLVCGTLIMAGCTHVTPQQQRLVSKPNMQFYQATMFNSQNRLLSQVESSLSSTAGGSSSGGSCPSCSPGG